MDTDIGLLRSGPAHCPALKTFSFTERWSVGNRRCRTLVRKGRERLRYYKTDFPDSACEDRLWVNPQERCEDFNVIQKLYIGRKTVYRARYQSAHIDFSSDPLRIWFRNYGRHPELSSIKPGYGQKNLKFRTGQPSGYYYQIFPMTGRFSIPSDRMV